MLYLLVLLYIKHFLRRFWLFNNKTTEKTTPSKIEYIKSNQNYFNIYFIMLIQML